MTGRQSGGYRIGGSARAPGRRGIARKGGGRKRRGSGTALLLAVAFAIGGATAAQAEGIDVKVKGVWDFAFGWGAGAGWGKSIHPDYGGDRRENDNFIARHRVRTQINFIASEYLQGVVMFEMGDMDWGRPGNNGGRLDADAVNVETKRAYLDWIIPNTEVSVRMGVQGVALPSGPLGSPILSTDVAGVVASSPVTDKVSLTGFWLRPFDRVANDTTTTAGVTTFNHFDDEVDVFGLVAPIKGSGWKVTPWGVYGFVGSNSGMLDYLYGNRNNIQNNGTSAFTNSDSTNVWWAGVNFELTMFNPFTFTFDFMYGDLHRVDISPVVANEELGTRGWFVDATLDYKLDWGTPGIFAWYASGDGKGDLNAGRLGRMPIVSVDTGFLPTHFGARDAAISTKGAVMGSGTGTWGVGVQIAKVSFVKDLTHKIKLAYYQGTNSSRAVKDGWYDDLITTRNCNDMYLTDKDHAWEVNFDHEYKIYENLTAMLELGYINLDLNRSTWRDYGTDGDRNNSAWKAQVLFRYSF